MTFSAWCLPKSLSKFRRTNLRTWSMTFRDLVWLLHKKDHWGNHFRHISCIIHSQNVKGAKKYKVSVLVNPLNVKDNDLLCDILRVNSWFWVCFLFCTDMDPLQNTVDDLILRISIHENIGDNMTVCLFTVDGMPLTDDPFFNTCECLLIFSYS